MIKKYKKSNKLVWTPEAVEAYKAIVKAIAGCQQLYFMNDEDPIFLLTDACNFGIGAYLCQMVEDQERPTCFLSKSLSATQQRWNTTDQECFAIFYGITQLEHLLLGRHFTLLTDHRNLTFFKETQSARVMRWKLALQHFDFDIGHIAGTQNVVADVLSRHVNQQNSGKPSTMATLSNARSYEHMSNALRVTKRLLSKIAMNDATVASNTSAKTQILATLDTHIKITDCSV
jgi:hypothetical protein